MSTALAEGTDAAMTRDEARTAFLNDLGLSLDNAKKLNSDASFRSYFRMNGAGDLPEQVVLVDSPKKGEELVGGHRLTDYVRISDHLTSLGFRVPRIFAHDLTHGFAVMEDFGDNLFSTLLDEKGVPAEEIYTQATDALIDLHRDERSTALDLPPYLGRRLHQDKSHFVEWYLPAVTGRATDDDLRNSYEAMWKEIEACMPALRYGVQLSDYHLDNILRLDDGAVGWIDVQDAAMAPLPYDLVNLLEDARRDIPADLRAQLKDRFVEGIPGIDRDAFEAWYRVMGTQFHCRVIGLFIRLPVRDAKPAYMAHLPRLSAYLRDALDEPVMAPFKQWLADNDITIPAEMPEFDPQDVAKRIRPDLINV